MKLPRHLSQCLCASGLLVGLSAQAGIAQVTPPEEYLGYEPGADFHLATYEEAMGYLESLAGQTERMQIFDAGPTSEGRRMKYAVISSAENMRNLDRYKEISRRLSLARGVSDDEARQLADEGRVIVWISGGIHSTEVAPPLHHIRLAYDLVAAEDRKTSFIRDNVVLVLVFMNPDGMTLVADWYMKNVGTPYEVSPLPVLYHKYAGHDNNRDSFMANLVETQNINRLTSLEWFPEIFYEQHQTGPFPARIWLPPGAEPVNPNKHPLILRQKNLIGSAMAHALDEAGQTGAISRTTYDVYYPGYVDGPVVETHNIPSILTETALYRYATPRFYTVDDFPEPFRDMTVGVFYPSPWEGGWWRLGDAVAYNLTASKAVMDVAAKYRFEFLYNKYRMGKHAIERFAAEPPYGWIVSADQEAPNAAALMLNRLIGNGVEVYTADEEFTHNGVSYPAGSHIVPTSQPFGWFVKTIFERQKYPDLRKYSHLWQGLARPVRWDGVPFRPYDGVGWTLPMQMGVDAREMSAPLQVSKTGITEAVAPAGSATGGGSSYVFANTDNNAYKAVNRILAAGGVVSVARSTFTVGGVRYPSGTFLLRSGSIGSRAVNTIASDAGISMRGASPNVEAERLSQPRIALYKSWQANMDAGWITLIFDRYDFPYHLLTDADVKAGDLRKRFDVIILPDQGTSSIVDGHRAGTMPPNYVGGMTPQGVDELVRFVVEGGTLICNNNSTDLAIEAFDLPIENVLRDVPADSFNSPGSILRMQYDPDHPIAYGMPSEGMAFFSRGRVFEVRADREVGGASDGNLLPTVVAQYPENASLLMSGWLIGEHMIQGKPAVVEARHGEGRIVLFGFNVDNRAQAYATFKLLFNAVYHH